MKLTNEQLLGFKIHMDELIKYKEYIESMLIETKIGYYDDNGYWPEKLKNINEEIRHLNLYFILNN